MSDDFDTLLGEAQALPAAPNALKSASDIVEAMARCELDVEEIEAALKAKNAELTALKTVSVPAALATAGLSDFTLADGLYKGVKVHVGDFVSGSLPKEPERRDAAIALLEEYEASDLIKDQIVIACAKSQHNEALDLVARLQKEGWGVVFGSDVHAMTLQKFGRERLEKGEPLDAETLGLYIGRAAKLSWPRQKKAK